VATSFPSVTILGDEMHAMAGESPAVVECPYNLDVHLGQILEKDAIVEIVIVDIVEMNNIWLYSLDCLYESSCNYPRT